MLSNSNQIINESVVLVKALQDLQIREAFFLVDRESFESKESAYECLIEAVEENNLISCRDNSYFSYRILGAKNLFGSNDTLIIESLNELTTLALVTRSEWESEDVLAGSDKQSAIASLSSNMFSYRKSSTLFNALNALKSNHDWLFLFHAFHVDLNVAFVNCNDTKIGSNLASFVMASGKSIIPPLTLNGVVKVNYY